MRQLLWLQQILALGWIFVNSIAMPGLSVMCHCLSMSAKNGAKRTLLKPKVEEVLTKAVAESA